MARLALEFVRQRLEEALCRATAQHAHLHGRC
jgi:hypothetical protein